MIKFKKPAHSGKTATFDIIEPVSGETFLKITAKYLNPNSAKVNALQIKYMQEDDQFEQAAMDGKILTLSAKNTELSWKIVLDLELVTGWEIDDEDGKAVPFSQDNLQILANDDEYFFIREAIVRAVSDSSKFTGKTVADIKKKSPNTTAGDKKENLHARVLPTPQASNSRQKCSH